MTLRTRTLASFVSAILILSVLALAPAQAIEVTIQGLAQDQQVQQTGAPIEFQISIVIPSSERVPIGRVIVTVDSRKIVFNITGAQKPPSGATFDQLIPSLELRTPPASQLFTSGYGYANGYLKGYGFGYGVSTGYGYGFGYGTANEGYGNGFSGVTLVYGVKLYPSLLFPGPHSVKAEVETGLSPSSVFSSSTINFFVSGLGFVGGRANDFSLGMLTTAFSLPPGGTTEAALSVFSVNNFVGDVTLNYFGPPDVVVTLDGQSSKMVSLTAGETETVTVRIRLESYAPPGLKWGSIDGFSGMLRHVVQIQVNVAIQGVPTLMVSPNVVSPGGTVSFIATGFTPFRSMTLSVQLPTGFQIITPSSYANNDPLVDQSGSWGGTVEVRSDTPSGNFMVKAVDGSGVTAFAPLTISGTTNDFFLNASPEFISTPPEGGTLQVFVTVTSMNQFASEVTLSLQGIPPGLTATFTGGVSTYKLTPPAGGFSSPVAINVQASPNVPSGDYSISIRGQSGTTLRYDNFVVNIPFKQAFFQLFGIGSITLSPDYGSAGSTVTLSGSGFPAGSTFNYIFFGRLDALEDRITLPSTVTVSASGTFSTQFTVPSFMEGFYPVHVRAGGRIDSRPFRLVGSAASFQISVSPSNIPPLAPGGSTELTVTVTSVNGKTPTVKLSVGGLPPSMFTTTFNQTSLQPPSGGTVSTTLAIRASLTAPPAPFPVSIEGRNGTEFQVVNMGFGIKPPDAFFTQFNIAEISLTPGYGAKNATITVKGTGFPTESGTKINGYRFGPVTGSFGSNPVDVTSGEFTAVIRVPVDSMIFEGGMYDVEFVSSSPTQPPRTGRADFRVISSTGKFQLTVSPAFLPPLEQGRSVNLSVSLTSTNQQTPTVILSVRGLPPKISADFPGFSPTATVALSSGQTRTVTLTISVDTYAPPGPYPFDILGRVDSEEMSIPVMFGVMPRAVFNLANMLISPDVGARGDSLTISGSGFSSAPSTVVRNVQFGPKNIRFDNDVSVTGGAFTAVVTVPSDVPFGMHPVTVADSTGRKDTKPFNVIPSTSAQATAAGLAFSFNMFASPPFVGPVLQNSTGTTKISVQSMNNQNPNVALRVDGLPPGVTASFDRSMPISVKAGQTVGTTLTLSVSSIVMPGPYSLSVSGISGAEVINIPLGFGVMPRFEVTTGVFQGFATLVVNPDNGRPGDQITISGSGFKAGNTISLFVKPPGAPFVLPITPGEPVVVQSDGTWSLSEKIPSEASPGFYEMIARDGTREARAPIQIVPAEAASFFVKLSPEFLKVVQGSSSNATLIVKSSNAYNTTLNFGVEDLPRGVIVTFYTADGTNVARFLGTGVGNRIVGTPTAVRPPAGGSLRITVNVAAASDAPPGPYPLFFRVIDPSGVSIGQPLGIGILPTGRAGLDIRPTDGEPGKQVSVSGSGFGNRESITLLFAGSALTSTIPSTITTDADGSFSAVFTVPSDSRPGFYPVEARGGTSGRIVKAPFSVIRSGNAFIFYASPPQIIIPAGGSGNFTLNVSPVGPFNSAVNITVSGLPGSFTKTFYPSSSVTPGVGTASQVILKVAVPSGTSAGAYFSTLTATSGSISIRIPSMIRVVAASTVQDFEVFAAPPGIGLPRGGSGNLTVIVRGFNGFSQSVRLSAQAKAHNGTTISGITADFLDSNLIPSATTGVEDTVLTLSASSSMQPGNYVVNITGIYEGTTRFAVIQVMVLRSTLSLVTFTPQPVMPQRVTPSTPLPIQPPWGDHINITGLVTDMSDATQIIPKQIPQPPSAIAPLPTGYTSALSRVTSIEPSTSVRGVNATLTFPYNATELAAAGLSPSDLRVAFLNENGTWVTLPTTFNTTAQTVTAIITHFSSWSVLGATRDFSLSANPASLTVSQGSSNTTSITVTSVNSFNSQVTLSASAATGITATFTPSPVTPPADGTTTSTLTLSVAGSVTAGTYTVTVTGTSGSTQKTTTVTLTVKTTTAGVTGTPPVITGTTASTTTTVSGTTVEVDATSTANVKVLLTGASYVGAQGTMTTAKYTATPPTTVTVAVATGNKPVKYIDVLARGISTGTAVITVTYTESEIGGVDESTLTLHYYSSGNWYELSRITRDTVLNTVSGAVDVTKLTGTIVSLTGRTAPLGVVTLAYGGTTLQATEGESVTFTATATYTDGTPAPSVTIQPYQDNVPLTAVTTGSDGTASFTVQFTQPGNYTIYAVGQLGGVSKSSLVAKITVLSKKITSTLTLSSTALAPGSSTTITLALKSQKPMEAGNVTFTLPTGFKAVNVTTTGFEGNATQVGSTLIIQKTTATTSSTGATISFILAVPIEGTRVGQKLNVTVAVAVTGLTTEFTTDTTATLTIQKPTLQSLFSVLDSYFAKTRSAYTEDRVPTLPDIFRLLDLYFGE